MDDIDPEGFDPRVHQAEGVLVARFHLPLREAVQMLRTWAAQEEVALPEMAREVLGTLVDQRRNGH